MKPTYPALVLLLATALPSPRHPARRQGAAPVAFWRLDETVGSTSADSSGNHNDGTIEGSRAYVTAGPAHVLRLSGAGSFVDVHRPVVDTSRPFTVTAAVRLNRLDGYQTFVSVDGSHISGFFLQLRADTGEFALTLPAQDRTGGDVRIAGSHVDPDAGVWYHLAGVYDGSRCALYTDGVLQQTTPAPDAWRAAGHTALGRGLYGGHVDFTNAEIANVRLYDAALPAGEIRAIARSDRPQQATRGAPNGPPTLVIDVAHPAHPVSAQQYGIMTEEINHSYDGGLYAELIRNRAFRDSRDRPVGWTPIGAATAIMLDSAEPVSSALPVSLRVDMAQPGPGGRGGVANGGFWGVPIRPGTTYRASLYARAARGFTGPLQLSIESADGSSTYGTAEAPHIGTAWRQYTVRLVTGTAAPPTTGRLAISSTHAGTVWLNLVSLFPPTYHNRSNGNRPDIMRKLAALKPAFLRFPGGNYLEGDTIATRFDWKRTVGSLRERPGHQGPWGYRSSDGMGLLEFLEWCEDLHMQPVLAVYDGYSLAGSADPKAHVAPGPPLQPYVQDALDEIEYVTGAPETKWGAVRARDGHPRPFPLRYVEIGNEDFFDRAHTYDLRFAQFYDAIKVSRPGLRLIATIPVTGRTPDLIDEHFYMSPRAFERDAHRYDSYSRQGPKIFVGEWASQEGDPVGDLSSALGDAAWMTGLERNADVVELESYAPLLVNVNPGACQWNHPNLIGYDGLSSFGSPSYYVQVLFAGHHGDVSLPATLTNAPRMAESVTREAKTGTIFVKLVSWSETPTPVTISLTGAGQVLPTADAITLTAESKRALNTIADPRHVVPKTSRVSDASRRFAYTLPANSVTVLELRTR